MEFFERAFSHVCGSANVWVLGGELLPFCQRCTGLYVGCVAALVAYVVARPRPTPGLLWFLGALLVGMLPFGYHWVAQNGMVRTVTGFLFACGIVYYLLLIPFERFKVVHTESYTATFAFLLTALVSLLLSVSFGGNVLAGAISAVGFLGLVSFGLLVSAGVFSLVRA